ncbi:MAG: flavin reductase [Balneolaceae bacterium]|nr:flavin reductase [Balneolaceae bacterium]
MDKKQQNISTLDLDTLWEQVYTVNPLVIIGSLDEDDIPNFAPKHMAFPLGWKNYFGFVCTPRHSTYQNIKLTGEFTVTYPKPDQVIFASLTATRRREDDTKPELESIPRFPADGVDPFFLEEGYLYLECKLERFVDGFGVNSLILGEITAAHADDDFIRKPSRDDNEMIYNHPLMSYLYPDRFSVIRETQSFPFPKKFKK